MSSEVEFCYVYHSPTPMDLLTGSESLIFSIDGPVMTALAMMELTITDCYTPSLAYLVRFTFCDGIRTATIEMLSLDVERHWFRIKQGENTQR